MADIEVQLQMARDFDARNDWVEIALSPAHARQIIAAGKLAMVLSIETSKLFGTKDWRAELDRFYALGVRSLQPVHQLDNRFAGAAPHNAIFQAAEFLENCHIDTDCGITRPRFTLGFDVDAACRNVKGLTRGGQGAGPGDDEQGDDRRHGAHVRAQRAGHVRHLPGATRTTRCSISHGHFREVMNPKLAANEKTTPAWVVKYLRQTGGMFGLRTAHDETRTYTKTARGQQLPGLHALAGAGVRVRPAGAEGAHGLRRGPQRLHPADAAALRRRTGRARRGSRRRRTRRPTSRRSPGRAGWARSSTSRAWRTWACCRTC